MKEKIVSKELWFSQDAKIKELEQQLERQTNRANNEQRIRMDYVNRFIEAGKVLEKERSHIKTCHITMGNHHKEMALKDSWVRHHQGSVEAEMKLRHKLEEKIKILENKLAAATPESSEATQVDNTK